jgi:uncharacterized protein YpmB
LTLNHVCISLSPTSITNLSIAQLKEIIAVKEQITGLEAELAKLIGTALPAKSPEIPAKKARKGISAAGKARIVAAQKAMYPQCSR